MPRNVLRSREGSSLPFFPPFSPYPAETVPCNLGLASSPKLSPFRLPRRYLTFKWQLATADIARYNQPLHFEKQFHWLTNSHYLGLTITRFTRWVVEHAGFFQARISFPLSAGIRFAWSVIRTPPSATWCRRYYFFLLVFRAIGDSTLNKRTPSVYTWNKVLWPRTRCKYTGCCERKKWQGTRL